jgi:hypothetical protein
MYKFRGTSLVTVLCLGSVLLASCAAKEESEVSLILPGPMTSTVQSVAAGDGTPLAFSATGLITNRACYFIHVTAADLNAPGTGGGGSPSASCKVPVSGLGKIFGPYKYGASATIKVPSGPGRVFDLMGFINPYPNDPDCAMPWKYRLVAKSNGEQHPEFMYGNYSVDGEGTPPAGVLAPQGFDGKFLAFARSAPSDLAPGLVKVQLNRIELTDGMPTPYSCGGEGNSNNTIFPQMQEGVVTTGMESELFLDIKCPDGVNQVSLRTVGYASHTYSNKTCVGGRANFDEMSLAHTTGKNDSCWFDWDKDNFNDGGNETGPCIEFAATAGSTFSGTPFIQGKIQFQSLYKNVQTSSTNSPLIIGIDPTSVKFAGYEKVGNNRQVYVTALNGTYTDGRRIDFIPQTKVNGNITSSFDWNGDSNTISSNQFPGTAPPMGDIILGKIDAATSLFFSRRTADNLLGLVKFSTPAGYPTTVIHPTYGDFSSASKIASENKLQVVGAPNPAVQLVISNFPAGSYIPLSDHNFVNDQIVRLNSDITDAQCGADLNAGSVLKVFVNDPNGFRLTDPATNLNLLSDGTCSLIIDSIQLFAMRTNDFSLGTYEKIKIPMFPGIDTGIYDKISKILIDAPTNGTNTFVTTSQNGPGILVTKCSALTSTNCDNAKSYRIAAPAAVMSADLLVGNGNPLLLVVGSAGVKRYSLGDTAQTPADGQTSGVLHPAVSGITSAKLRSLRLQDQGINRSNEALLYVEHGGGKHVYRTRDSGVNWYRVHTIPNTNTIHDIIPSHAHTKSDDGSEHWEPSFLMLERFDKDGSGSGTAYELRVIGQDWHGF